MKTTAVRLFAVLSLALLAQQLHAFTLISRFDTDPLAAGWQIHGETNLFTWDATNQNLTVTWDSSKSNSYFHRPLGTTLTRSNGFLVAFDLTLINMPVVNGFQIAAGLLNITNATATNFFRGTGFDSPNLAELDYFVDPLYGPSMDASLFDAASSFAFTYDNLTLAFGTTYRIQLTHAPGSARLNGLITLTNGVVFTRLPLSFALPVGDFELNTLSVSSYSDENGYGNSVLANGTVDNFVVASPLPVETLSLNGPGQVTLASDTNWVYTLEASTNLLSWTGAAPTTPGNGSNLVLQATSVPATATFYRVRADLP